MAYDRRPILTLTADKFAVRDFVASRIGPEYLIPLHGIYEDPASFLKAGHHTDFAAKVTHASGGSILVSERFDRDFGGALSASWHKGFGRLRVHPNDYSEYSAYRAFEKWLNTPYSWQKCSKKEPEWAYENIERRIIVEELLHGSGSPLPDDTKFFAFNGTIGAVRVDRTDEYGDKLLSHYTSNGDFISVSFSDAKKTFHDPFPPNPLPLNWPHMASLAAELSRGFSFVRVDLYSIEGRIYFGELTHYPTNGRGTFRPNDLDKILTRLWYKANQIDEIRQ